MVFSLCSDDDYGCIYPRRRMDTAMFGDWRSWEVEMYSRRGVSQEKSELIHKPKYREQVDEGHAKQHSESRYLTGVFMCAVNALGIMDSFEILMKVP
jgi:hypothetical protein